MLSFTISFRWLVRFSSFHLLSYNFHLECWICRRVAEWFDSQLTHHQSWLHLNRLSYGDRSKLYPRWVKIYSHSTADGKGIPNEVEFLLLLLETNYNYSPGRRHSPSRQIKEKLFFSFRAAVRGPSFIRSFDGIISFRSHSSNVKKCCGWDHNFEIFLSVLSCCDSQPSEDRKIRWLRNVKNFSKLEESFLRKLSDGKVRP